MTTDATAHLKDILAASEVTYRSVSDGLAQQITDDLISRGFEDMTPAILAGTQMKHRTKMAMLAAEKDVTEGEWDDRMPERVHALRAARLADIEAHKALLQIFLDR